MTKKSLFEDFKQNVMKYLTVTLTISILGYFGQKLLKTVDQSEVMKLKVEKLVDEVEKVNQKLGKTDATLRALELQSARLEIIIKKLEDSQR